MARVDRASLAIFVCTTLIKLLLMPAYRSTDFEVHRNWLAVTSSLPLDQWYTDTTSPWTLDYPPVFAWFERLLAVGARYADPRMLEVDNLDYASWATVYYQRMTVVVSDCVLWCGIVLYTRTWPPTTKHALIEEPDSRVKRLVVRLVAFSQPALLLVDHVHFQYNGLLIGLLLIAVTLVRRGLDLEAAFVFAVLVNAKHMFLYCAPVFAVYLFRHYCCPPETPGFNGWEQFQRDMVRPARRRFRKWRFLRLAGLTLSVFAVVWAPFAHQLPQVFRRLFPFERGLSHAYWAPNVWALYNAADVTLARVARVHQRETELRREEMAAAAALAAASSSAAAEDTPASLAGGNDGESVSTVVVEVCAAGSGGGGCDDGTSLPPAWAWLAERLQRTRSLFFGQEAESVDGDGGGGGGSNARIRDAPPVDEAAGEPATPPSSSVHLHGQVPHASPQASATGGKVGVVKHAVLPSISPRTTMYLAILCMLPVLFNVWNKPHPRLFMSALTSCLMTSFMVGWHVHEKALMLVCMPLSLCFLDSTRDGRIFVLTTTITTAAVFPLLFRPEEFAIKVCLLALHTILTLMAIWKERPVHRRTRRIGRRPETGLWPVERLYLWGFPAFLLPFTAVVCPWLLPGLPFLPLLVTSVYCALGCLHVWFLLYREHFRKSDLIEAYE